MNGRGGRGVEEWRTGRKGVQGRCANTTCHRPPRRLRVPTLRGAGRRPSVAGSHVPQPGEAAELRGQAAAQAVLVKVPASNRGTPAGEREGVRGEGGGEAARGGGMRGAGSGVPALRAVAPPRPLAPFASPRSAGRAAAERAHMYSSAVRSPSCVGRLPLRLLLLRYLRARGASAGEREGVRGVGGAGGGVPALRAIALAPSPPRPLASPRSAGQGGGLARRAHIDVSAVRPPSCVGRVPLRL